MEIRSRLAIGACLLALMGCSPLPQAALVYSSRVSYGITVTSNPASASAATFNVGYDALDAAYVPVSVAGASSSASSDQALVQVRARYADLNDPKVRAAEATNLAKVADYAQAQKNVETIKSSIQQLNNQKLAVSQVKGLKAMSMNGALEAQLRELTQSLPTAEQDAAAKQSAANDAARQLAGLTKEDALSVYGRFDSKGDAGVSAVGLSVGKVFSTGIAAQNVSEGVQNAAARTAATLNAYANCIQAAKAAGGDAQKCADLIPEPAKAATTARR